MTTSSNHPQFDAIVIGAGVAYSDYEGFELA